MPRAKPAWPILQRGDPLSVGLVGAWPFYEGSGGTLNDLSGKGYNATFVSQPVWVGGDFGAAISFNGGAVATASNLSWTTGTPISVALWINTSGGTITSAFSFGSPASSDPRIQVHLPYSDNNIYWDYDNTGGGRISTSLAAYLNKWTFVVLTNDGSAAKSIWLDGKSIASNSTPNGATGNALSGFQIGRFFNTTFAGSIADLKIYNRALSASEIAQLYYDSFSIYRPKRRVPWFTALGGGATSYSFPTKSWTWNHQAPSQAFSIASSQKPWQWHGQAPAAQLSLTAAQKPWRWSPQAPVQSLVITPTQKAWQWSRNAPVLAQAIVAATKAWTWAAGATIAGGNISAASVLRYIGAFRRRRSHPPM
jgi:hypothetical protein